MICKDRGMTLGELVPACLIGGPLEILAPCLLHHFMPLKAD